MVNNFQLPHQRNERRLRGQGWQFLQVRILTEAQRGKKHILAGRLFTIDNQKLTQNNRGNFHSST